MFVDGAKILQIADMKKHIVKVFSLKEPFHLLLNETEYLPPTEDIRILKEDETILVCPGPDVENGTELPASTVPGCKRSFAKLEPPSNSVQYEQVKPNISTVPRNTIPLVKDLQNTLNLSNELLNRSHNDSSEVNIAYDNSEDEANDIIEIKATTTDTPEDLNVTDSSTIRSKRKRIRRKKNKPQQVNQTATVASTVAPTVSKKPKILDSLVIPSSKHIHFDNVDTQEVMVKHVVNENKVNGSSKNKVSPSHELSNLLSLGKNSVPLTFTNPVVKDEIKVKQVSDDENQIDDSFKNRYENIMLNRKLQEGKKLLSTDLEACQVTTTKPQLKDIIAFKMLKIGADYTPQVSEFIVAEVISHCPKTLMYTFKILQGASEVQVPVGKFTIIQNEEEQVLNDTITVNYSQVIEPRYVLKCDPDRVANSVQFNNQ